MPEPTKENKKLFSRENQAGDKFNFARKLFHLVGLIIPIGYFFRWLDPISPWLFRETTRSLIFWITGIITILLLIIEFLRFRWQFWQNLFVKVAGRLLKEKELNKMHGSVPYLLALCLVVGFFPRDIAILSILFLSFGDPAAALVGGRFGTIRFFNGKSLQGTLGGIAGAFIAGTIFLILLTATGSVTDYLLWDGRGARLENWLMLGCGAITAFVVEFFSHEGFFDDNLTIPVASSLAMVAVHALATGRSFTTYFYSLHDLVTVIH
ncbi:MAG: hypothetical protein N2Z22_00765 [Turneriella sp.]|nr:hypothetical protein [Turneriella sp.]